MPRTPVNPIDPLTGKRRMGRPRKNPPVDTMQGPQPAEKAIGRSNGDTPPVEVTAADVNEEIKQSLPGARFWRERMGKRDMLRVPSEALAKYPGVPEDCYCWAPNTKEGISEYHDAFGYDPVQLDTPLRGQTDTTVQYRELILMVRSPELKRIHDEVRQEAIHAGSLDPNSRPRGAEREAMQQVYQEGGRPGDVGFFEEEDTITPAQQRRMTHAEVQERIASDRQRAATKGAPGRGSRFWTGGIPQ